MYNQYCSSVLTSVKIFLDADQKSQRSNFPSQSSQPFPSSQESSQKAAALGTTLTQAICQMGVNTGEPPDEIYQRHVSFEFQPTIEPEEVVEEVEDDIYFDASEGSASMDIEIPLSPEIVEERFSQYHDDIENYASR